LNENDDRWKSCVLFIQKAHGAVAPKLLSKSCPSGFLTDETTSKGSRKS
jgi:hypothetical protein